MSSPLEFDNLHVSLVFSCFPMEFAEYMVFSCLFWGCWSQPARRGEGIHMVKQWMENVSEIARSLGLKCRLRSKCPIRKSAHFARIPGIPGILGSYVSVQTNKNDQDMSKESKPFRIYRSLGLKFSISTCPGFPQTTSCCQKRVWHVWHVCKDSHSGSANRLIAGQTWGLGDQTDMKMKNNENKI